MRFWLDKGVDGFRLDALAHIFKDKQWRNNPPNPDYNPATMLPFKQLLPVYDGNQPEVHVVIAEMRRLIDEYAQCLLIGELYLPVDELVNYYGWEDRPGLHLPYNFQLIQLPWSAVEIYAGINKYEGSLPAFAWPSWVLGNHDKPRVRTRVGAEQARVAALLLLTLRGTPTMYYGDELGMANLSIPAHRICDPVQKAFPGQSFGRDPERTPMQWQAGPGAGFSAGEPWLPLAANYNQENIETEAADESSLLVFYHRLIRLRQKEPALRIGGYRPVAEGNNLLVYLREYEGRGFLVAANLSHLHQCLLLPQQVSGRVVLSTNAGRQGRPVEQALDLGPDEGLVAFMSTIE
jgi:alpha-glucosidase